MRSRLAFLGSLGRLTSFLIIATVLLAFQAQPGRAAVEEQNGVFDVHGTVQDEAGDRLRGIPVSCWVKESSGRWAVISDSEGRFLIPEIPNNTKTLSCWTSDSETHEKYDNDSPIDVRGETILPVGLKTIPMLKGVITTPRGKLIPHAFVKVTDAIGTTVVAQANDKGEFQLENLKAGKAKVVKYTAEGYQEKSIGDLVLSERASLSVVLQPNLSPVGLLLLIPGIVVLALQAVIDLTQDAEGKMRAVKPLDPKSPPNKWPDPNAWLIIASLVSWGLMFFALCHSMRMNGIESLTFFDPSLSFPLFVPACGFLGALVWVIDLFQQKRPAINTFRQFAMRLVLAPYVAIIIVIFFGGTFTFIQLTNLESRAALAFFSGFLVVLFLQGLTERGNEILGRWRSDNRYEPSEIARKFGLDREDDLKLRKANLKYLAQLQAFSEDDLRVLGRQTDLGEGFLVALQSRLRANHLQAQLGQETWEKLNQEGVETIWDVALLTPERLEQISKDQHIDQGVLTRFYEKCQAFVYGQHNCGSHQPVA
jgi:hypothetical protein